MFAYYARWIDSFATKVRPLAEAKTSISALAIFVSLKAELRNSALQSIDESFPLLSSALPPMWLYQPLRIKADDLSPFCLERCRVAKFTIPLMKRRQLLLLRQLRNGRTYYHDTRLL